MHEKKWAEEALNSFDAVVGAMPGFRSRDGQRKMASQIAQTLSQAQLGKIDEGEPEPRRAIAVVQAGTGVGKSLAYSIPAIRMALSRGTRVLISTATVALQEQLVNKDLPALAQKLDQPFKFALAKGRGRFVCKLKLERLASTGEAQDEMDDLFGDEQGQTKFSRPQHELQARMQFYKSMADALATQAWNGDRDSLETPPEAEAWSPVAAESSSCTGKHCPAFGNCVYYERRKDLVAAQVIVANHDLLLSSLGSKLLPELDNCLLVLDEAHHLPSTALDQFAGEMDLSRLGWIDKLASRALRVNQVAEVEELADVPKHAGQLRQQMQELARLVMEHYGETLKSQKDSYGPARVRAPRGMLPEALLEPLGQIAHHADGFLDALRAVSKALRAEIKEQPEEAQRLSTVYAQVGALAPRLEAIFNTTQLLLQNNESDGDGKMVPHAKWFTLEMDGEFIVVKAHASPIQPGSTLRQHLWSQVRGAVLTSATLTSCGHFDFFLREAGLTNDASVTTLEVPSPFDYARQGTLVARETASDPREAARFTEEMVEALLNDLSRIEAGALVLFTSREQMRQAVDALSTSMRNQVLVQTALPRQTLLARHREAVAMGEPSIIFGMQSFGEGLDLPGALCESLFITKLPFAPPDDPVGEARAEWLRSSGRNPFNELVVPATAIRLAQWVGRAIRTEEDQAHVYCYDRRLTGTSYGQLLIKGLPPFTLQRRPVSMP
ncbi:MULTISPECIES: ATP-dependent DNA helicase DinG [Comamonas]|uniref:ATP-dependent DNA helicase DinG n=1 Tax=Comamonas TaxID=283 RepID=UPI0009BB8ECA|nr:MULTISPECIES: ATP-dependent DNA helicase DinG [Comamonas]MDH1252139.1 ATP-dependent DNA helicase DinG [Comamonas thiooxydans]TYK75528.1 ATP-dependent DNA helicase DinG [Comamonas sp. Z1]BCX50435.1 ATP-dependent DNA helicase DinG [Comamonas testosteroni]